MFEMIIRKKSDNFDHDNIRFKKFPYLEGAETEDIGFGFRGKKDGTLGLQRCPVCKMENFATHVITGECGHCGFSMHTDCEPLNIEDQNS